MRVIPKTAAKKISFIRSHLAAWTAHAEELGLSADEIAELNARLAAAQQAFDSQRAAQLAARSATLAFHGAAAALAKVGASAVLKIRATARGKDPRKIYPLASLPVPKKGSPIGAPGRPDDFHVQLRELGQLLLKWKCKHPRNSEGTVYEIWRSIDGGEFTFLNVTGKKRYTDSTLPAGAKTATYRVTAMRSTRRGKAGGHVVNLGVSPANVQMIAQSERINRKAA